jgi:hypothetical protein
MHDFYSIHVMSYCEGFLDLNETGQRKNLTGCSNRTALFSFNPSEVLLKETGNTTSLADMGWPTAVSDDFRAFRITSKSMGVFYCIGVGTAGLVILARLWFLLVKGPRQTIAEVSGLLVRRKLFGWLPSPDGGWHGKETNYHGLTRYYRSVSPALALPR